MKLTSARADRVLGEYTHYLPFGESSEFVIIYGPNGVGKTKFLEIVHALLRLDGRSLSRLPFGSAELYFSDGRSLTVESGDDTLDLEFTNSRVRRSLIFRLKSPDEIIETWLYSGNDFEDWLVENTSWRPIELDLWEDRLDREVASYDELQRRYPEFRPRSSEAPALLAEFIETCPSYLIETQRLRIEQYAGSRTRTSAHWSATRRAKPSSKITEHATKMRSLVNEAQTEHSKITQQLDRTFPNRVLTSPPNPSVRPEEIRRRYNEQNEFRSRLGRVASVALEDALSLPGRDLEESELRLLSLYLDDADKKLAPFESLLQKIELLEEIINSRLLNKKLQITAGDGLTVQHQSDGRPIQLDSLSSGEQHEIILMFDLLFNVPSGALVLIDEPEISLHVIWQIAFIPDVERVAELAGFRFVVATHSPQIINDSWDQAVRLGPDEAVFQ